MERAMDWSQHPRVQDVAQLVLGSAARAESCLCLHFLMSKMKKLKKEHKPNMM